MTFQYMCGICLSAVMLMGTVARGQSVYLDMEPPAYFSGNTYYEDGSSYGSITASNQSPATFGLQTSVVAKGSQSMFLSVPGEDGATQDATRMSRREWRLSKWSNEEEVWYSFKVCFDSRHENPAWYGTVLSQIKISYGYGFQYALYMNKTSAGADIPLAYRYFERTGPDADDVIKDSGVKSTGKSLKRNRWYWIKINFKNSSTDGKAFYKVWLDGVQVINLTGLHVVGYQSGDIRFGSYGRVETRDRYIYFDELKRGKTEAEVAESGGQATPAADTPTIRPDGGGFTDNIQVSLSCATTGAAIRYTTNGSAPTSSSTLYTGPFTLTSSATVKAQAFKSGLDPSDVASASFTAITGEAFIDNFDDRRLAWTVTTASRWTVETDGTDKSYHLNTSSFNNDGDKPGEMALVSTLAAGDCELTAACKSPAGEDGNANRDYGMVFGYQDADNFWYLLANGTADNNQLFQVVNGSRTEKLNLGSALISDSEYHTLKVVLQNGNVTIYQDNVKKGEVSAAVADGKVGVCSYNDEAWFDDFTVTPLDDGSSTGIMPEIRQLQVPNDMDYMLYSITGRGMTGNRQGRGVYFQVINDQILPVVITK